MKSIYVIVALVFGVSLIVSTAILSSAIKAYGRSLEIAAINQPRVNGIPTSYSATVSLVGGNLPLRFDVNSKP
jgi:hypothetical protein